MPDPDPLDEIFDLAVLFARQHRRGGLVFWTAATDWQPTYGVTVRRLDPERVHVAVRDMGRGTLQA